MGRDSIISWTKDTHNFWLGCHHVSEGCDNCYADRIVTRMWKRNFNKPWLNEKTFDTPLKWEPSLIFTCSMSDFFLNEADLWRPRAWDVIRRTPQHQWQILTKRPQRIKQCLPPDWGPSGYPNVWLGTSVESPNYYGRIKQLVEVPAAIHFLSLEPLLADLLGLPLDDIEWVIVGGESGSKFRPMQSEWAQRILALCQERGIPFFGKQRAGHRTELPLLFDGKEIQEMPKNLDLPKETKSTGN